MYKVHSVLRHDNYAMDWICGGVVKSIAYTYETRHRVAHDLILLQRIQPQGGHQLVEARDLVEVGQQVLSLIHILTLPTKA